MFQGGHYSFECSEDVRTYDATTRGLLLPSALSLYTIAIIWLVSPAVMLIGKYDRKLLGDIFDLSPSRQVSSCHTRRPSSFVPRALFDTEEQSAAALD